MESLAKKKMIGELQKKLLLWQGYAPRPVSTAEGIFGLGSLEAAFPNAVFPASAVHEFLTGMPEQAAAAAGFVGGLLKTLMSKGGACLWINGSRTIFPPALKAFGIDPDRVIFIDVKREKDLLWATEEALKCGALAAVVAEVPDINFVQSRRLQLAVEQSKITGFILRKNTRQPGTTACAARWRISPLPSEPEDGLPGVGFPRWKVELLKVRNGRPGVWEMEWVNGRFVLPEQRIDLTDLPKHSPVLPKDLPVFPEGLPAVLKRFPALQTPALAGFPAKKQKAG